MIIDLIRHTTPEIEQGLCYGQSDLSLKPSYPQEFARIHDIVFEHYDLVISSPLQRCLKLANTLSSDTLTQDLRIMEYNFGDWELKPWSELRSEYADTWMKNFVDQAAPNGDSMVSMQSRVLAFWSELLQQNQQRIAVVTHSGVQRIIHAHILQAPLTHMFRLELDFGAVMRVNHNAETELSTLKHLSCGCSTL